MKGFYKVFCLVLMLSTSLAFSQSKLDSYKYIIVPEIFEFQKHKDQFQLNSLTIFLFKRANFTVLSAGDPFPEDLAQNPCLGLKAKVVDIKAFLKTKMNIEIYDCNNNIVFTSDFGNSKEKDYKKAYHDGIRKAFVSIEKLGYNFDESSSKKPTIIAKAKPEIKKEVPVKKIVPQEVNVITNTTTPTTPIEITKPEKPILKSPEKISENINYSIVGKYYFDMWGECEISKKGNAFVVVGGDENFEFAKIFSTSKPNLFMIKKIGFSQTQLLEIEDSGNLKIDGTNGVNIYKRIN